MNMGNLPLDEFYPAVSMVALMRIFRDQSLSHHHTMVVQAITFIFKSLGLKCVQFLPQVMPTFLNVIRVCDGAIREVSVLGICFPLHPKTSIYCKENATGFRCSCTECVAAKHALKVRSSFAFSLLWGFIRPSSGTNFSASPLKQLLPSILPKWPVLHSASLLSRPVPVPQLSVASAAYALLHSVPLHVACRVFKPLAKRCAFILLCREFDLLQSADIHS